MSRLDSKRTIKALRSVLLQTLCGRLVFPGPILIFSLLYTLRIILSRGFESTKKLMYLGVFGTFPDFILDVRSEFVSTQFNSPKDK